MPDRRNLVIEKNPMFCPKCRTLKSADDKCMGCDRERRRCVKCGGVKETRDKLKMHEIRCRGGE